ncbi:MAG: hypothetical protein PHC64_11345 [Candidatus Gastranaerophilales bacterium]|nr:hypothetical protein [Candidatus Gastranaerophilales bacterium]
MIKEKIQQKIEGQLEALEESLKYQLDAMCETLGSIRTIQYLMFLNKKIKNIQDENNNSIV